MGVGISECVDFKRLNIAGLWSLLKVDCITCDFYKRFKEGTKCKDCNFVSNSGYNSRKGKRARRNRVGCGVKFRDVGGFKPIKYSHVGKHQLYFFLFNPELKFQLPDFPPVDMFGNPPLLNEEGEIKWVWHIHHLNGIYYDDRKENLALCLNTEHKFIDKYVKYWRWNY